MLSEVANHNFDFDRLKGVGGAEKLVRLMMGCNLQRKEPKMDTNKMVAREKNCSNKQPADHSMQFMHHFFLGDKMVGFVH